MPSGRGEGRETHRGRAALTPAPWAFPARVRPDVDGWFPARRRARSARSPNCGPDGLPGRGAAVQNLPHGASVSTITLTITLAIALAITPTIALTITDRQITTFETGHRVTRRRGSHPSIIRPRIAGDPLRLRPGLLGAGAKPGRFREMRPVCPGQTPRRLSPRPPAGLGPNLSPRPPAGSGPNLSPVLFAMMRTTVPAR